MWNRKSRKEAMVHMIITAMLLRFRPALFEGLE